MIKPLKKRQRISDLYSYNFIIIGKTNLSK